MSEKAFNALSANKQAFLLRQVNKKRMTWNRGYGFDGTNTSREAEITNNIDQTVLMHNEAGVFDKHVTANNDLSVPTADANYDGWMRFGSQTSVRTCLHETGHALGCGTYKMWGNLMYDGVWHGRNAIEQLAALDGPGAVVYGDALHFWPYGLNQESEDSGESRRRHILMVAAMQ